MGAMKELAELYPELLDVQMTADAVYVTLDQDYGPINPAHKIAASMAPGVMLAHDGSVTRDDGRGECMYRFEPFGWSDVFKLAEYAKESGQ